MGSLSLHCHIVCSIPLFWRNEQGRTTRSNALTQSSPRCLTSPQRRCAHPFPEMPAVRTRVVRGLWWLPTRLYTVSVRVLANLPRLPSTPICGSDQVSVTWHCCSLFARRRLPSLIASRDSWLVRTCSHACWFAREHQFALPTSGSPAFRPLGRPAFRPSVRRTHTRSLARHTHTPRTPRAHMRHARAPFAA